MGLFNWLMAGRVLFSTAKAIRKQRKTSNTLADLPTKQLVPLALERLNKYRFMMYGRRGFGQMVPPRKDAIQAAKDKNLPDELVEFYALCNGFSAELPEFTPMLLPLEQLRLGSEYAPSLAQRIQAYWADSGNDSDLAGTIGVLPQDDFGALIAQKYIAQPDVGLLDHAIALTEPDESKFTVVLLQDVGDTLKRGQVLDVESGGATCYTSFNKWLSTMATLMDMMQDIPIDESELARMREQNIKELLKQNHGK